MSLMTLIRRLFGAEETANEVPVQADPRPVASDCERDGVVAGEPRKRRALCMYAGCYARKYTRGVCQSHYDTVRHGIVRGTMTEAEAILTGLWLPSKLRRRHKVSWNQPDGKEVWEDGSKMCIHKGCARVTHRRGACWNHYGQVRDSIRRGEFTEAEAIRAGLILAGPRKVGVYRHHAKRQEPK